MPKACACVYPAMHSSYQLHCSPAFVCSAGLHAGHCCSINIISEWAQHLIEITGVCTHRRCHVILQTYCRGGEVLVQP